MMTRISWARTGIKIASAALVAAAGTCAVYEALVERKDRVDFPAPGALVDIGGYRLHMVRSGAGGPTVVLDAGLAGFSLDWALVVPRVAAFTEVVAYDRAGYGWSDEGPDPRDSAQIADELHTLLHAAGIEPPYVLVGHSFGGFNVRLFANRYPDEVAGMVLVDPSHEDEITRMAEQMRKNYRWLERAEVPVLRFMGLLARLGGVRLAVERGWSTLLAPFNALPEPERSMALAYRMIPRFFRTAGREDLMYRRSGEQARHAGTVGDMPLVVLTGMGSEELGASPLPFVSADNLSQATARMGPFKRELHADLARRLSTRGEHIVTERSGHLIALSEPELVAEAIRRVVTVSRACAVPSSSRGGEE